MKVLLLCALLSTSCASLRAHDPFRMPDGTLDVMKVLQFIQYGIEADCQFGTTAATEAVCTFGRSGVAGAMAIANRDPTGAVSAVRNALIDLEARVPTTKPYIDWAILVLK